MTLVEGAIDIQLEETNGILILHFKGKLDALSSPNSETKIMECISSGHNKLVFDFSGVDYLSSAGLRILLSTQKRINSLKGMLVLCSIQDHVMSVLKMTGFDHLLNLTETLDEAQNKFI